MGGAARLAYEPGLAARLLGAFAGEAGSGAIVGLPSESSSWYSHALSSGAAPRLVVLTGFLCAGFTALNLCRPAPAPKLPSSLPNLAMGGASLMLLWLLALLSFHEMLEGYLSGLASLRDATTSSSQVHSDLSRMNRTIVELQGEVSGLLGTCHGLEELVRRSLGSAAVDAARGLQDDASAELLGLGSLMSRLRPGVGVLMSVLRNTSERLAPWISVLRYCFLTPVKLSAVSLIALFAVLSAHSLGGAVAETVDAVGIGRIASVFAVMVVLSAASSGAALLGLGSAAGALCSDVDYAAVRLAGIAAETHGAGELLTSVANFYIFGQGENPLLADLAEARRRSQVVSAVLVGDENLLGSLGLYCPEILSMHLQSGTADLEHSSERDMALLGESRMYRHYMEAVHAGFCGQPLAALCRLVLFQVLVGTVCLPIVAALARPWIGQGAGKSGTQPGRASTRYAGQVLARRERGPGKEETGQLLGGDSRAVTSGTLSGAPSSPGAGKASPHADNLRELEAHGAPSRAVIAQGTESAIETACEAGDVEFLREASRLGTPVSTWDLARAYGHSLYSSVAGGGTDSPSLSRAAYDGRGLDGALHASDDGEGMPREDPHLANFVPRKRSEAVGGTTGSSNGQ